MARISDDLTQIASYDLLAVKLLAQLHSVCFLDLATLGHYFSGISLMRKTPISAYLSQIKTSLNLSVNEFIYLILVLK